MKKEKKHTKRGTKQKTWNIYIYKKKCKANTQKKKTTTRNLETNTKRNNERKHKEKKNEI